MKKTILFLMFFVLGIVFSQNDSIQTEKIYSLKDLEKDISFKKEWKAKIGNDSLWSSKNFDDSDWENQKTRFTKIKDSLYKGEIWFRKSFVIDSSLVNIPIALSTFSRGDVSVYLNGKYLGIFGKTDGTHDFSAEKNKPSIFVFNTSGEQVLAIKYQDSLYQNQTSMFGSSNGFSLKLKTKENYLKQIELNHYLWLVISSVGVVFFTLGFIHLILFGFYRKFITNLFFAIFNICSGISILFGYARNFSAGMEGVMFTDTLSSTSIIFSLIGALAISATVNFLFSKNKTRFYILVGLVIFILLLIFFVSKSFITSGSIFTSIIMFEAILIVFIAALNKKPNARMIATGLILSFTFAMLLGVSVGVSTAIGKLTSTVLIFIILFGIISFFSTPFAMSAFLASNFASVSRKLNRQLKQVNELSDQVLKQEQEKKGILENKMNFLETEVKERTKEIEIQKQQIQQQQTELLSEKQKSEDLLLNILPKDIADELKESGESKVKQFDNVSILFSDFTNLDSVSKRLNSQELLDELNHCFKAFDNITTKHQIEKIKTISYSYMAVSGLPLENENHAKKMIEVAFEMLDFIEEYQQERKESDKPYFEIKIGINSGEVVAGIVGIKKFAYDIWGDAVNTAARMKGKSENSKINVGHTTYELAKEHFDFIYRGEIEIKGKGLAKMYFVEAKTN